MNLKSLVKAITPPIVQDIIKGKRKLGCSGSYATYDEACQAIPGYGYEKIELIDVIYQKTEQSNATMSKPIVIDIGNIRTILALSLAKLSDGDEFGIIDFGGACGAHFFTAKAFYGKSKFKWHVVETRSMVAKAKSLENEELKFFSDLDAARETMDHIDMVFSSGALQCVRDPLKSLKDLLCCNADYIFLTRLGLTTSSQFLITCQTSTLSMNGPGPLPKGIADRTEKYPVTFVSKEIVEDAIRRQYNIVTIFHEEQNAYLIDQEIPISMYGYFGVRHPKSISYNGEVF